MEPQPRRAGLLLTACSLAGCVLGTEARETQAPDASGN
jgi:hypothetical protein